MDKVIYTNKTMRLTIYNKYRTQKDFDRHLKNKMVTGLFTGEKGIAIVFKDGKVFFKTSNKVKFEPIQSIVLTTDYKKHLGQKERIRNNVRIINLNKRYR